MEANYQLFKIIKTFFFLFASDVYYGWVGWIFQEPHISANKPRVVNRKKQVLITSNNLMTRNTAELRIDNYQF